LVLKIAAPRAVPEAKKAQIREARNPRRIG
jgi:hypothetical protein